MKRWIAPACGLLLAGCGWVGKSTGDEAGPDAGPEEQLDPYRSPMSARINEVLYSRREPAEMLEELALLGAIPGMDFGDFKSTTYIDDWFAEKWGYDHERYWSLTCGLSPVVDDDGRMIEFYRGKKTFDGKLYEELRITPE